MERRRAQQCGVIWTRLHGDSRRAGPPAASILGSPRHQDSTGSAMAQPETSALDTDEHVLTASGEFDVHDAPIDISIYRFEEWVAFVFFWALSFVIFLQFFTRYAMNDSAS